jgi:hypothetical protein
MKPLKKRQKTSRPRMIFPPESEFAGDMVVVVRFLYFKADHAKDNPRGRKERPFYLKVFCLKEHIPQEIRLLYKDPHEEKAHARVIQTWNPYQIFQENRPKEGRKKWKVTIPPEIYREYLPKDKIHMKPGLMVQVLVEGAWYGGDIGAVACSPGYSTALKKGSWNHERLYDVNKSTKFRALQPLSHMDTLYIAATRGK